MVQWTAENDRILLLSIIAQFSGRIDLASAADRVGDGCTERAVSERLIKLRKLAAAASSSSSASTTCSPSLAPSSISALSLSPRKGVQSVSPGKKDAKPFVVANKSRCSNGSPTKRKTGASVILDSSDDESDEPNSGPSLKADRSARPVLASPRKSPRKKSKVDYDTGDERDGDGNGGAGGSRAHKVEEDLYA